MISLLFVNNRLAEDVAFQLRGTWDGLNGVDLEHGLDVIALNFVEKQHGVIGGWCWVGMSCILDRFLLTRGGYGTGETLIIGTGNLRLSDDSRMSANTFGCGTAGRLAINASDAVEVSSSRDR